MCCLSVASIPMTQRRTGCIALHLLVLFLVMTSTTLAFLISTRCTAILRNPNTNLDLLLMSLTTWVTLMLTYSLVLVLILMPTLFLIFTLVLALALIPALFLILTLIPVIVLALILGSPFPLVTTTPSLLMQKSRCFMKKMRNSR